MNQKIGKTAVPQLSHKLPEFVAFAKQAASDFTNGKLISRPEMHGRVQTFFTSDKMTAVEAIAPGWQKMASEGNSITLDHVMTVFTGLYLLPEFQQANLLQQVICEWAVLFHDITKWVQPGQRDLTHGFRSAAVTAEALPRIGFPQTAVYAKQIAAWAELTKTAVIPSTPPIQDNQKLPHILHGLDHLFGANTPATLITQTVLFHMSLNVVKAYPQAAPLSVAEIKQYMGNGLRPLLKIMMLADNEGWVLFDTAVRQQQRQETLEAFAFFEKGT